MGKSERYILLLVGILTLAAVGFNVMAMRRAAVVKAAALPPPKLLQVSPQSLFGKNEDLMGQPSSPYTLVEFADYQCPPCRAINPHVTDVVAQYRGRLKYAFHNLPLTRIHPFARPAAIAAEAARKQGQFWPVHEALFEDRARLTNAGIAAIPADFHLDRTRFDHACATSASAKIAADMRLADDLDLQGTPSFLLCCPDGRVLLLGDIGQVSQYVH